MENNTFNLEYVLMEFLAATKAVKGLFINYVMQLGEGGG